MSYLVGVDDIWWHPKVMKPHTSTQSASTQTEVFEKAFFVYETNSITASLDCFTLKPICDSVNLHYKNQFKAHEQFCNNKILTVFS